MSSTNFFGGNQGAVRKNPLEKNPYEQFDSTPSNAVSSFGKNIASEINKTFGKGLVDSFFNNENNETLNNDNTIRYPEVQRRQPSVRREFNVFTRVEHFESKERPRELEYLHKQIVQEVKEIKAANAALMSEIRDIDNLTVENMENKDGVYYVRFLELIISILKTLRMKINESRTWLGAVNARAKKRGAAFGARAKKHGTSFSLSQELSTARSVQ